MKKTYFVDLAIGLTAGLIFFFTTSFVLGRNVLFLEVPYYLTPILIFLIYALSPWFKKRLGAPPNKFSIIFASFLFFLIGFFLPIIIWLAIVLLAFSRGEFSL